MLPKTTALLLLVAQQAWDEPYWGERNNPDAEARMAELLAGFTTSHGISSTARSACELGFKTVVVGDACVAFELDDVDGRRMPAEVLHQASLAALQGEFAMVLPTAALLPLLGA